MTLYDKVQFLCKESKTNIAQLEKTLGFGNGTMQRWNKVIPRIDKVQAVAKHFNIGVDELIGCKEPIFSLDAHQMAVQYDDLSEGKRVLVKQYIDAVKAS